MDPLSTGNYERVEIPLRNANEVHFGVRPTDRGSDPLVLLTDSLVIAEEAECEARRLDLLKVDEHVGNASGVHAPPDVSVPVWFPSTVRRVLFGLQTIFELFN